jgi:hypothetical protein
MEMGIPRRRPPARSSAPLPHPSPLVGEGPGVGGSPTLGAAEHLHQVSPLRGGSTACSRWATTSSVETPSASAWKFTSTR